MTRHARPIRFLAGTALVLALSAPAFAQSTMDQTNEPPAATEQGGDMQAPTEGTTLDKDAPTLKNTLSDEPVDPLKNQRKAETADKVIPGNTVAGEGMPAEPILTAQKPGQVLSDKIIGMDVRNPDDESIGTIDALVIDKRNRVVAGIVSVGGFLGIGAKDVAVNWKEFTFQPEEEVATVMLSRQQLENAPAFRNREDVQAQLQSEEQRRDVQRQQDRMQDQAEPPVTKPEAAE